MNILVIGDVTGQAGCEMLRKHLPGIKKLKDVSICIANGENSAQGNGITPQSAKFLFDSGVDFITTGNHVFRRNEMHEYLDSNAPVIRPANYTDNCPGRGFDVIDTGKLQIGIINLMGTVYMEPLENPFHCIDRILPQLKQCRMILVDFHGEATSEKRAMGFYLDGKVSALFGTHTHVQTADDQILPNGTGYITDVGMTGPKQSVLGVSPEIIISRLKNYMPTRFVYGEGSGMLNACLFSINEETGKTVAIERLIVE